MKKIIFVFTVLFAFLLSSVGLASCNLDESRWKWLFSTDEYGCFYDKNTAIIKSASTFEVWTCNYYPGNTSCRYVACVDTRKDTTEHYHYFRIEYDSERYTAWCKNIMFRDNAGRIIGSFDSHEAPQYNKPLPIPPDSINESTMLKIKQDLYKYRR